MKKGKKRYFIGFMVVIILLFMGFLILYKLDNRNFIKLNYDQVINKIDHKDTFILCVSRKECIHCNSYKPKLKSIANKYNVKAYYVDIDNFSDSQYDKFKEKVSFDGSTPTTIFFKNGDEKTTASRIEGDVSKEKIVNKLKKNGFIK